MINLISEMMHNAGDMKRVLYENRAVEKLKMSVVEDAEVEI